MQARRTIGVLVASAALAAAPASAGSDFGAELVGWWKLDETAGTRASDSSGLGNHGDLTGGAAFIAGGFVGGAVSLPTGDAGASAPHSETLEPATGTIQVWVNLAEAKNADVVSKRTDRSVRREIDAGISVIGLRVTESGEVHALIANDDPSAPGPWTTAAAPAGSVTPGRWHHLAMRWDGAELAVFVDGEVRDSQPYDPVPGSGLSYAGENPFLMGFPTSWGPVPGDKEYLGLLDDVRFYGRARTDVEIFTDYRSGGHKPAKPAGN